MLHFAKVRLDLKFPEHKYRSYEWRHTMISRPLRAVFLEPKPPNPHIFSLYALPRLGGVLLATLLHQKGWDVQVFVEEVGDIDFDQVLKADLVGISTITSTAPRAYAMADELRTSG